MTCPNGNDFVMSDERDPQEAIEEIREEVEEGDEPSASEREFLEGEEVDVGKPDDGFTKR
jgi:hypothetical protein